QGTFALLAKAKSVTHVSGMNCHPSLGKDKVSVPKRWVTAGFGLWCGLMSGPAARADIVAILAEASL
ncbi:hypothetical protein GFL89_26375, partial [Rhizobium leguminosarum bv. viciae]|nr:hypothetical protein [Rhizobium leguminosarum bv. viciae]